jgi:hypothetical protein
MCHLQTEQNKQKIVNVYGKLPIKVAYFSLKLWKIIKNNKRMRN